MPISLNNSKDIVAITVSTIKGHRIIDLVETVDAIQGLAPEAFNSWEKLATALSKDYGLFNILSTAISDKDENSCK